MSDTTQSEDARLDALDPEKLLEGTTQRPWEHCGGTGMHYICGPVDDLGPGYVVCARNRLNSEGCDDANFDLLAAAPDLARALIRERQRTKALTAERDAAQSIIMATMRELPVGHIPAHTAENVPQSVRWLASEVGKLSAENDALTAERDALREQVADANNRAQVLLFERDEARDLVRLAADVEDDKTLDAVFVKVDEAVARWDAEKTGGAN